MPAGLKSASGRPAAAPSSASREEIARVAYQLYEQRGRTPGHDREDWLEAERIVRARAARMQR